MKNSLVKLSLFSVLCFLASCSKTNLEDENNSDTTPINDTIYYNPDISDIVASNCIGCHSGNFPSAGVDLTTYANVKFQTENGSLIQRINSSTNPMPQSGLMSTKNRQIFDQWVTDLLKESK